MRIKKLYVVLEADDIRISNLNLPQPLPIP